MKLQMDDPEHTDWMVGGGIPLKDYNNRSFRKAQYKLSFKFQQDLLNFKAHVLCGTGTVVGKVLHPEPDEEVPKGSIIVIPFGSPKYVVPALSAGPTGAVITERGGDLMHLTVIGREQNLRIVRVKSALLHYPAGSTITVDCSQGTVELEE
jgi:phosphohistidine swiveling domain-containing protein